MCRVTIVLWSAIPSLILVIIVLLPTIFARSEELVPEEYKYFSEPGTDNVLGHYDQRFFRGIVSNHDRKELFSHMMRAYLDFFDKIGLDTWIAHGTLLGWWWNAQVRRPSVYRKARSQRSK